MKVEELRIGNWVKMKEQESFGLPLKTNLFKIKGFGDGTDRHQEGAKQVLFWAIDNTVFGKTNGGSYDIDCEPIPLTEDILVKCGYVEFKTSALFSTWALVQDGIIEYRITQRTREDDHFTFPNRYKPIRLKYLHQLQNLLFCLTDEELNIEL